MSDVWVCAGLRRPRSRSRDPADQPVLNELHEPVLNYKNGATNPLYPLITPETYPDPRKNISLV